jgi:hypothetical protein
VTIKTLRGKFYDKKLEYACSFDSKTALFLRTVGLGPGGFHTSLRPRPGEGAPTGELFHVLDALTVAGVDGAKHECPTGKIDSLEESLCFEADRLKARVQGRASFEVTGRGAERHASRPKPRIYMTYTGSLRFRSAPTALLDAIPDRRAARGRQAAHPAPGGGEVVASAWIVPSFFTEDSRYKWLGQVGCVAFGTWTAQPYADCPIVHDVTTAIDIYAAG